MAEGRPANVKMFGHRDILAPPHGDLSALMGATDPTPPSFSQPVRHRPPGDQVASGARQVDCWGFSAKKSGSRVKW